MAFFLTEKVFILRYLFAECRHYIQIAQWRLEMDAGTPQFILSAQWMIACPSDT